MQVAIKAEEDHSKTLKKYFGCFKLDGDFTHPSSGQKITSEMTNVFSQASSLTKHH